VLFVDAGDFTGDLGVPGEKQTEALIDGMNLLGYKVAALSQRELNHGWDAFQARRGRSKFPFVSANIVWQDTGALIVDPYVVVKAALRDGAKARDVRLGFIGLTAFNPTFQKQDPKGRRIVTSDPIAAATAIVPQVRAKADVVVVLASLDLDAARNLARKVKDIDLILGGQGAIQTRVDDFPEDSQFGRTRLQYIGDQGKNVGEVRLTLTDKRAVASVQRAVVGLTREWPDEPALAQLMSTTKEAVNAWNREQVDKNNPFAPPPSAPSASPASAPPAAPNAAPAYTGSERCMPCHESEFAIWTKSAHARAFQVLVRDKQDFNPQCVGCHTVGYGKPLGFVSASATPTLKDVGCESCHGPSSRHPGALSAGYGRTSTDSCRDCHTKENSPDFDPTHYIPLVRHWSEAQAAR
jgi:Cytochrome c554 and c-prime